MFWGLSDRFVTARKSMQKWSNWCYYRTSTLNKVAPEFSQRTNPIHSIGPKTQVLGRFGPFRYSTKFDAKLAELVPLTHKFATQSRVGIFCNERTRSTPLDPRLMFWGVSDRLLLYESRCKTGRTGAINEQVR
jgi:hypothetical protein